MFIFDGSSRVLDGTPCGQGSELASPVSSFESGISASGSFVELSPGKIFKCLAYLSEFIYVPSQKIV